MNLYLISQDQNAGYDTYDSAVVVAESEDQARNIHPQGSDAWEDDWSYWASSPEYVEVKLIGTAHEFLNSGEVICSSYNAG